MPKPFYKHKLLLDEHLRHWHVKEQSVPVQQAQSPSLVNSGDGGSEVYLIVQSEQVHAGFGGADQMRNWAIDSDWKRNERSRGREKKGGGLDDRVIAL